MFLFKFGTEVLALSESIKLLLYIFSSCRLCLLVALLMTPRDRSIQADCYLYSIGLLYLPVSTYSLICASQIAFNAFFSYFLNSQKLIPIILNSLFLLTISSTLLAFNNEEPQKVIKGEYVKGFICTVGASAGYGLVLSLHQLAFRKVLKKQLSQKLIYVSLAASCVTVVGLLASGEWKNLSSEMENYKHGNDCYLADIQLRWHRTDLRAFFSILKCSKRFGIARGSYPGCHHFP
ncbi:unnamed protein product [Arabis nemorensis]|uniref:Uncharacterized protein n=1 Tax=Arabis nemorensis TaxID=586526 RepID=A0A565CGH6_9BRAS|nr:unnamed protein product [Arabis nemorensis]